MESNERNDGGERDEIYSRAVRAGKRTYFFDVKTTRRNDFYLTITERKKRFDEDGHFSIEKHKLFLYREDFEKFKEGLQEVVDFIGQLSEGEDLESLVSRYQQPEYAQLEFDDLMN